MKHISIIGAGCVGSVLIERLLSSKQDIMVSVIAENERELAIKKNGITVNDQLLMIRNAKEIAQPVDLIFVCVKNYDLDQACNDMEPYIGKKTVVIPLLNSVSPTPAIRERFPDRKKILYGYISKIDSHRVKNGFKYNIAGDLHFGYAKNDEPETELLEIKHILEKAGFNAFIDTDMKRGVWRKWMLNVGANQVSALTGADYLQFAKIPEIENVLRLAMQELLTIACYEKVNLSTQDIMELLEYLTTYPYPKKTSMLQDVLEHRKTEIDYISGDIIRMSQKWNCPCPVNLTMYYLIKSKEKCYLE